MAMEDATLVKRTQDLFILRAKVGGKEFPLHGEMLVGREAECSIPLDSGHISRYHAKINVSGNSVYIEDLQSTNGTFVNGIKTKGRIKLSVGDEINFDDIFFRLASSASGNEDQTALAAKRYTHDNDRVAQPLKPVVANDAVPNDVVPHEPSDLVPQEIVPKATAPKPVAPTPIRPSIVTAEPALKQQKTGEYPGEATADSPPFPKADDIDLENPLLSRRALAEEPDFEKHLEERFGELDALMDASEQSRSSASMTGADLAQEDIPLPERASSAEPAVPMDPAAEESRIAVDPAHTPPAQDADRTQLLSASQLDYFIERHRHDQELIIGKGPRLIVTTAPLRGKLFSLTDFPTGSSLQIGRDPNAEIYLNDKTISTDHARITKTDDSYFLVATHAKNGMSINGVSGNRVHLNHNDKIQIGRTELVFKTDTGADDAAMRTPTPDTSHNSGQGRRYSMVITIIALIVLVGAIVATSR